MRPKRKITYELWRPNYTNITVHNGVKFSSNMQRYFTARRAFKALITSPVESVLHRIKIIDGKSFSIGEWVKL